MVAPFMISREHPLYSVNDVFNAVFVTGNMLGDSMYYGRGAGKLPTASAVVSDVVDCARHLGKVIMCFWEDKDAKIADVSDLENRYFVRVKESSREKAESVFADGEIINVSGRNDFAIITQAMKESVFAAKCGELGDAVESSIRLY